MKLPVSGEAKKLLFLEESPLNIPLDDSHGGLLEDQAEPEKPVVAVQLKSLLEQDHRQDSSVQQQSTARLTEATVSP